MSTVNPIAGTLVFLLGGVAAATYLLPFCGVKGWAYETGWLVSVVAGWFVFPLVFDAFAVPDFWGVLGAATPFVLLRSFGFGVLWGVGALCWALMGEFRYISFAVLMSSAVFFSAILGVILGEWKGTSWRTRTLLSAGIVILAFGFAVMAVGGK